MGIGVDIISKWLVNKYLDYEYIINNLKIILSCQVHTAVKLPHDKKSYFKVKEHDTVVIMYNFIFSSIKRWGETKGDGIISICTFYGFDLQKT